MFRMSHLLSALGLAALCAAAPASASQLVNGTTARMAWQNATGPVAAYAVFEARNGAPFPAIPTRLVSASPTLRVTGAHGETVRIKVVAVDAQGNLGPPSAPSNNIEFQRASSGGGSSSGGGTGTRGSGGGGGTSSGGGNQTPSSDGPLGTVDLDDNGTPDLLYYDPASGDVRAWLMSGNLAVLSRLIGTQNDPALEPVDMADFDGDGQADILWLDTNTGDAEIWLLRGTRLTVRALPRQDIDYRLSACADFDRDGKTDLLWSTSDGRLEIWYMDSSATADARVLLAGRPSGMPLVGVADLDGDEKPDLIWRNGTSIQYWKMNGVAPVGVVELGTASSRDQLVLTQDLDGDGKADLVWQRTHVSKKKKRSYSVSVWYSNGLDAPDIDTAVSSKSRIQAHGVTDVDADGQLEVAMSIGGRSWAAEIEREKTYTRAKKNGKGRRTVTSTWSVEWAKPRGLALPDQQILTP